MGYDITFHPISTTELQYFIFDPLADKNVIDQRVRLLTSNPEDVKFLKESVYHRFEQFKTDIIAGNKQTATTISFAGCAIAGFLHPYWYARGSSLSFLANDLPIIRNLITRLSQLAPSELKQFFDYSDYSIQGNYSAGGYVRPENLNELKKNLRNRKNSEIVRKHFDETNQKSLETAIDYCLKKQIGFIEASDIYVPLSGQCYSEAKNFRAGYLKNLKKFHSVRAVIYQPDNLEECLQFFYKYQAEIIDGVYDLQLKPEWIAHLPYECLDLLSKYCFHAKVVMAECPDTPTDLLIRLARDIKVSFTTNIVTYRGYYLTHLVMKNPAAPLSIITEFCNQDHGGISLQIANHPTTTPELLDKLIDIGINSRFPALRIQVAGNPKTSRTTLLRLVNDSCDSVREKVKDHPNFIME